MKQHAANRVQARASRLASAFARLARHADGFRVRPLKTQHLNRKKPFTNNRYTEIAIFLDEGCLVEADIPSLRSRGVLSLLYRLNDPYPLFKPAEVNLFNRKKRKEIKAGKLQTLFMNGSKDVGN